MPYNWIQKAPADPAQELRLWPHQSLPPRGFAAFMLGTFALATLPLFVMLGTILMWGLLPFVMLALGGVYYALRRNDRDRQILEVLTVTPDDMRLVRHDPRKAAREWHCNPYWAQLRLHPDGGPVPNYITLAGAGREVEIGAFLSEDERMALYGDLSDCLRRMAH
ncbi:DUF2244 domain-containing protein [Puniceibacterium sp. IMCC21224]|uniref:DUF2244 domain-containing protein n=1 Tax=Puniceibacterium sp. IMCC21224 TaxID=1618204 RepID=UPI00064DD2FB|nr:DUF2244 domain-containing protein [Puniceibacterium sp. IMCC21224]KMK66915.1 integral membrane protein [Puniceibacterium sp. IMCC21224]